MVPKPIPRLARSGALKLPAKRCHLSQTCPWRRTGVTLKYTDLATDLAAKIPDIVVLISRNQDLSTVSQISSCPQLYQNQDPGLETNSIGSIGEQVANLWPPIRVYSSGDRFWAL